MREIFQSIDVSRTGRITGRRLHDYLLSCEDVARGVVDLDALILSAKLDKCSYEGNSVSLSYHEFVAVMLVQNRCSTIDPMITHNADIFLDAEWTSQMSKSSLFTPC